MEIKIGTKCDICSQGHIIFKLTPESVHYGKLICDSCNKWFKWVAQPNPEGERKKVSIHSLDRVLTFYKIKEPICFFCLRNQKQLGFKETLTRDHIVEMDKGGEDILENLQILCSACHKLKNWMRLYNNWHTKGDNNE